MQGGWNRAAIAAMVIGALPSMPGLLQQVGLVSGLAPIWGKIYDLSIFVGLSVASAVYATLMRGAPGAYMPPAAPTMKLT